MDEQLISEVQQHAIIYNRQKSNAFNGDKCVTKELAWQDVAQRLGSDVETCKKRWKYLRERYVQQKKSGGSPHYEHLSRPYLEKMKFLDNFIQSRKSYRQGGLFPSPATPKYDVNDNNSSRSNSSMRMNGGSTAANDSDDALAQFYMNQIPPVVKNEEHSQHRTDDGHIMASSSSSIASQESPMTLLSNSTTHDIDDGGRPAKRLRTISDSISERNHNNTKNRTERDNQKPPHSNHLPDIEEDADDDDDDDDDVDDDDNNSVNNVSERTQLNNVPPEFLYNSMYEQNTRGRQPVEPMQTPPTPATFPNAADFLHPIYQQMLARQLRSSDQLLGELVTSELMKMSRDRKKIVQKKILEVLFFDDE